MSVWHYTRTPTRTPPPNHYPRLETWISPCVLRLPREYNTTLVGSKSRKIPSLRTSLVLYVVSTFSALREKQLSVKAETLSLTYTNVRITWEASSSIKHKVQLFTGEQKKKERKTTSYCTRLMMVYAALFYEKFFFAKAFVVFLFLSHSRERLLPFHFSIFSFFFFLSPSAATVCTPSPLWKRIFHFYDSLYRRIPYTIPYKRYGYTCRILLPLPPVIFPFFLLPAPNPTAVAYQAYFSENTLIEKWITFQIKKSAYKRSFFSLREISIASVVRYTLNRELDLPAHETSLILRLENARKSWLWKQKESVKQFKNRLTEHRLLIIY